MQANQTECSRLEEVFVIKFSAAGKWKSCEIYRRMSTEKQILIKKNLQMG